MKSIKITTYVAGKYLADDTLKEFSSLSQKLHFELYDHGTVSPIIEIIKSEETKNENLDKWIETTRDRELSIIKFSTEVPYIEFDLSKDANEHGMTNEALNVSILRDSFEKRIMDVIVVANIAQIGSINIEDSMTEIGNYLFESGIPRMGVGSFDFIIEIVEDYGWPKLYELDFMEVWDWAHHDKEILDGFANKNRLARAIHAYSRLLEVTQTQDSAHDLMWAMIGIEALYVKGKVSVMEQVREKIQIFLGQNDRNKKLIAKMYNFRSRLMHGDLGFPGIHFSDFFGKEFENYSEEIIETIALAIAILAATIQEIIIRDWKGLEFTYQVTDKQ